MTAKETHNETKPESFGLWKVLGGKEMSWCDGSWVKGVSDNLVGRLGEAYLRKWRWAETQKMSRSQPCEEPEWNVPGEGIGNAQTVRSRGRLACSQTRKRQGLGHIHWGGGQGLVSGRQSQSWDHGGHGGRLGQMRREILNALKDSPASWSPGSCMLGERGDQHESHAQALGQRDLRNLDSVSINTLPLRRWGDRRPQDGKGCHTARLPQSWSQNPGRRKRKQSSHFYQLLGVISFHPSHQRHCFTDEEGKGSHSPELREPGCELRFSRYRPHTLSTGLFGIYFGIPRNPSCSGPRYFLKAAGTFLGKRLSTRADETNEPVALTHQSIEKRRNTLLKIDQGNRL